MIVLLLLLVLVLVLMLKWSSLCYDEILSAAHTRYLVLCLHYV